MKSFDPFSRPNDEFTTPTYDELPKTNLECSEFYQTLGAVRKNCELCNCKLKYYKNKQKGDGILLRCPNRECRKVHPHRPEVFRSLKGDLVENHRHMYLAHLDVKGKSRALMFGITEKRAGKFKRRYRNF